MDCKKQTAPATISPTPVPFFVSLSSLVAMFQENAHLNPPHLWMQDPQCFSIPCTLASQGMSVFQISALSVGVDLLELHFKLLL